MGILHFTRKEADVSFGNPQQRINTTAAQDQARKGRDLAERYDGVEACRRSAMLGNNSTNAESPIKGILGETTQKLLAANQLATSDLREQQRIVDGQKLYPIHDLLVLGDAGASSAEQIQSHSADIAHSGMAKSAAERELNEFREDRGSIRRKAFAPNITVTAATCSILSLAELLISFFLYSDVANGGVDAVIYSALATLITFACGALIGASARHALHGPRPRSVSDRIKRSLAWFGASAGSVLLVGSALLLGHFRDDVTAAAFNDGVLPKLRLDHLAPAAWFDFQTLQGLLMTGMTVIFGLIAAWKAYSGFSDPIPGYSRVQKAATDTANDLLAREQELREAASALHNVHLAGLQERLDNDAAFVDVVRQAADRADVITRQYDAATTDAIDVNNTAVRICEEAYNKIRPDHLEFFRAAYLSATNIPPLPIDPAALRARAIELEEIQEANRTTSVRIRMGLTELRAKVARRIAEASRMTSELDHDASARGARRMMEDEL